MTTFPGLTRNASEWLDFLKKGISPQSSRSAVGIPLHVAATIRQATQA